MIMNVTVEIFRFNLFGMGTFTRSNSRVENSNDPNLRSDRMKKVQLKKVLSAKHGSFENIWVKVGPDQPKRGHGIAREAQFAK